MQLICSYQGTQAQNANQFLMTKLVLCTKLPILIPYHFKLLSCEHLQICGAHECSITSNTFKSVGHLLCLVKLQHAACQYICPWEFKQLSALHNQRNLH